MRLLYLAQRVPYPPDRGDKIITYNQVCHLARNHEVVVACFTEGPEDRANIEALASRVAAVHAIPLSPLWARLRAYAAFAAESPLTVKYFAEREFRDLVRQLVRTSDFDAIVVYSSSMAQFVERVSDVPRLMHFADLDSQKWRLYADHTPAPLRWVYRMESRRLLRYEQRIAASFSHSLVCTAREADDFRRLIPNTRLSCVNNGVDLEYFRPREVEKDRNRLIFTGVMDYFPNVDAVAWFCRDVLPLVQREVPDVSFTICGARPSRRVRALARLPGVTVTGRVSDVRPHLSRASVAIVPLRLARGVQNKLLEAMAMGLPAVATPVAFGGIDALDGRDLLVANGARAFATSVVRLLCDDSLRARMGHDARLAMEANYRWDATMSRFDGILESILPDTRMAVSSATTTLLERTQHDVPSTGTARNRIPHRLRHP